MRHGLKLLTIDAGPDPVLALPVWQRAFAEWVNDDQSPSNAWIHGDDVDTYVRMDFRPMRHEGLGSEQYPYVPLLTIASIGIVPRGRGTFGRLLDWIEPLQRVTNVENIIGTSDAWQQRLCAYLARRGYVRWPRDEGAPSMYRVRPGDDDAMRCSGINAALKSSPRAETAI